ncbi:4-alpha-glucanotransferase [Patulibacter sp.]|uniref:4-alpha-glucanotransferase n=1 Tax=Patulibacter sp. TaxID=1912859 RepID=UPI002721352E|nr:4-alpha-glucanotransferase [Patulibacter sp.]MDO9406855.1 4-alpha-glucanotransferase [Patulibacter sp.]
MAIPRSSGVQLHLTSLPGGRLGPEAYAFVDWLQAAGQSWWQTLPLGPPDEYRSPYKSASAFAAWNGFLEHPDAPVSRDEEDGFRARHGFWVTDWEAYAGDGAVADQVRFEREWAALRAYAAERGVRMIGDVPIYVAPDGADHRAHPELFRKGVVSGAPPDAYSDKGQFWANPVYDWPALSRRRYRWWTERFRRTFDLFDLARIDHFRGFVSYWAVPEDAPDASYGRWARGPGRAVFDAAARELRPDTDAAPGDDAGATAADGPSPLPLIAEDLGVITPAVERLRDGLGLPGMVVLQFAFDPDDPHGPHRPENHRENQVLYTGTHDNDTLRGWWDSIPEARRAETDAAIDAAGVREEEPWWSLIALAQSSRASLCMMQVQDLLGLGGEHRMNVPGEQGGSWGYRLESGQLTAEHAARLRALTVGAGR